ncbi:MAG TPA: hypothetical protein VFQ61_23400 [Polyangiaceae bacterium]|nr:hypothetical protein [Polyangiaceae bacterium]
MLRPKSRVAAVLVTAAVAPLLVSASAHASSIELFAQVPYEFETGEFDLNDLEWQNTEPLFAQNLHIPYATLETQGRAQIAQLTKPLTGHEPCGDGILDPLCPDADWTVTFTADFRFTQHADPVLTAYGTPAENGVRAHLETELSVQVNAHVHVETSIQDADFDVPIDALIGVSATTAFKLYPVLQADELDLKLTWRGGNVELEGLDGQAIADGAVLGTALGFTPLGAVFGGPLGGGILGAVTGQVALDAAKEKAKGIIEQKAKAALESAGTLVTNELGARLRPKLQQANNVLASIRAQPVPGTGLTLGQLESALGMSMDVRSVTVDDVFRSAITTRFANSPGAGQLQGLVVFPRTACNYQQVRSKLLGNLLVALDLKPINQDLVGKRCSEAAGELAHRAYYGENPDRVLKSGAAQNQLATWATFGALELPGDVVELPDALVCSYGLSGLPNTAIFEVTPERGSALTERLSSNRLGFAPAAGSLIDQMLENSRQFGQRLLLLDQGGLPAAFDHEGTPLDPMALDFGGPGPASPADCPTVVLASGTGLFTSPLDELENARDPEKCPYCVAPSLGFEEHVRWEGVSAVSPQTNRPDVRGNLELRDTLTYSDSALVTGSAVTATVPGARLPQLRR